MELSQSLSGGEVAPKRASSATGAEEDRISALPDELLVIILLYLWNAADAARTSVLSRRWRTVWTLLPGLCVRSFPEPLSFRRALTASQLRLDYLDVEVDRATLESLAIWLPAAARRLSGPLLICNHAPDPEGMPPKASSVLKRERKERYFEVPCFENATKIVLDLGFVRALMPFAGVFAQLTVVVLQRVWFKGACLLGDAVSSSSGWRCPCLQVLKICNASGLARLAIYSETLLELVLDDLDSLWHLTIEAAVLKKLTVDSCFLSLPGLLPSDLIANVSAPQLVFLEWRDLSGQCCLKLGQMPHLQSIGELSYFVYGLPGTPNNTACTACMKLLQPFKTIESLVLTLTIMKDLTNCPYLMEDMKVLPNPDILHLNVHANGHSFGVSSFHVLRMCLGIKKLVFVLLDNVNAKEKTPCLPGCVCDEQSNWKTEELLLINLQEIEIKWLRGSVHEVSIVKRLLNLATSLNKMTVTLSSSTTESNAMELFHMFKNLCKPEVCIKLINHNHKKVLYAT